MKRTMAALGMLVVQLLSLPTRAYADGCPSPQVDDVLNDPRVQEALDQAWRDSQEGTDTEHEEGAWIQQCRSENVITHEVTYYTQVLRWPPGDRDSSAPGYPPRQDGTCRTVASFHTHPGPPLGQPGSDGYENDRPSGEDYLTAASDGVPGIIRYGSGDDTHDFTYNYGTVGDEPREPGWECPTTRRPGGGGYGDPHMLTLDGLAYDFMAIGDFLLMGSLANSLEIQARLQPYGSQVSAAITTGIAVRNGRDRIEWRLDGQQLLINGVARQLGPGASVRLRSYSVVKNDDDALLFISSVGDRLRVKFSDVALDYYFVPASARKGTLRGLFGNLDGDPDNDLKSANGQLVSDISTDPADYQRPLYARFGESWRIAAANTLFSTPYAAPSGVDARTFPRVAPGPSAEAQAAAETACKAAGVTDQAVLDACVFDRMQSGGTSFMASAARADRDVRESVPLAAARTIQVDEDIVGRLESKSREVVYPVTLPAGTYLFDGRGSYATTWRLDAATGDDFLAGMNDMGANPHRVTLAAGRYRLRVALAPESATGRFRFRVRKPAAPEVSPLAPGTSASGRIDAPGQMRVFQLQLQAGKYTFVPKSEGELWWSLTGRDGDERFDANQRVFMERADGLEIPTSGVYTLSVSGREWAGTGSYDVSFMRVP